MDVQFILRDKYRLAVLEDLSNGELSEEVIAKRNHLPSNGVERAVRELRAEELVGGPATGLYITEQGKALLAEVRGMRRGGGGTVDPKALSRPPDRLGPEEKRRRKENQGA